MRLTMSIVYRELSKIYHIRKNRSVFADKNQLEVAVLWEGQTALEDNCLYIGGSDMVKGPRQRNHSFVVISGSAAEAGQEENDVIFVEDSVSLFNVLNTVQSILHRSAKQTMALYRLIDKPNALDQMMDIFHEMIGRHVYLMTPSFSLMATSAADHKNMLPQRVKKVGGG